jgi:molecular chaperone GrpE
MKHKDKEKPKEEDISPGENGIADFYGLLDSLLPQKSELLQDLRVAMENCKKCMEETLRSDKNEADYALEIEKEKTKCLLELYKVAVNQYLRLSADYANFQKRAPKQIADSTAHEKEKIIKALLPPLDNFERTLQNAQSTENIKALSDGVRIIYDQILDILRSQGVEQIKAVGEKFDPALYEAIMQKTEADKEDNVVLAELQKGYKINGRAMRPSRVIVNKLPPKQGPQETTQG